MDNSRETAKVAKTTGVNASASVGVAIFAKLPVRKVHCCETSRAQGALLRNFPCARCIFANFREIAKVAKTRGVNASASVGVAIFAKVPMRRVHF